MTYAVQYIPLALASKLAATLTKALEALVDPVERLATDIMRLFEPLTHLLRRLQLKINVKPWRLFVSHALVSVLALQFGVFYSLLAKNTSCIGDSLWTSNGSVPKTPILSSHLSQLVVGAAQVDIEAFMDKFTFGWPMDGAGRVITKHRSGGKHVVFFYRDGRSSPRVEGSNESVLTSLSLDEATSNCRYVKHVITNFLDKYRNAKSCLALVGQADSYFVAKWLRTRGSGALKRESRYEFPTDHAALLRKVPSAAHTSNALHVVTSYVQIVDEAMSRLRPLAEQVANAGYSATHGVVVVMVCNFGHSEIMINFVCAARTRDFDLRKVLMFATDQETYDLAISLGITAFYYKPAFPSIPKQAAAEYGDSLYGKIMMSKAYCVHLVSKLGFDVLFQDVDIIPYRSKYLEFFVEKARSGDYDLYFQNDFNSRQIYAPWVSNSGCYYAVFNNRTRYFFESMVMVGDSITAVRSHQTVMHVVLSDQASQFGLRIKNLHDEHHLLPIGWHFHRNATFMKEILQDKSKIMSFHMNWNSNKEDKRMFLEQMGDWYVRGACLGAKTLADVLNDTGAGHASQACCSAEPLIRCNYRDKPSVIPCRKSPSFDKDAKSFW